VAPLGVKHIPDVPEEGLRSLSFFALVGLTLAAKKLSQALFLVATLCGTHAASLPSVPTHCSSLAKNASGSMGNLTLHSLVGYWHWTMC
jgi:hypothetical protein